MNKENRQETLRLLYDVYMTNCSINERIMSLFEKLSNEEPEEGKQEKKDSARQESPASRSKESGGKTEAANDEGRDTGKDEKPSSTDSKGGKRGDKKDSGTGKDEDTGEVSSGETEEKAREKAEYEAIKELMRAMSYGSGGKAKTEESIKVAEKQREFEEALSEYTKTELAKEVEKLKKEGPGARGEESSGVMKKFAVVHMTHSSGPLGEKFAKYECDEDVVRSAMVKFDYHESKIKLVEKPSEVEGTVLETMYLKVQEETKAESGSGKGDDSDESEESNPGEGEGESEGESKGAGEKQTDEEAEGSPVDTEVDDAPATKSAAPTDEADDSPRSKRRPPGKIWCGVHRRWHTKGTHD